MPDYGGFNRVATNPQTGVFPGNDNSRVTRQIIDAGLHASNVASNDAFANLRPSADPAIRYVDYCLSPGRGGDVLIGHIVDGAASVNAYIVELWGYDLAVVAEAVSPTSSSVLGAAAFNAYTPGTTVLVYRHPTLPQAFILGSLPPPAANKADSQHDVISQTTRKCVDEAHVRYLKMKDGSRLMNFSAWQPLDSTMGNEWGAITSTGLGVSLDNFMVKMSVNEFTGVFGFYHDSLLRLSGYNMQTWTAGHERDAYMDQAEYNDTQGYTPYPWEHMGALFPGQDIVQEYDDADLTQADRFPYYGHWENKYDNLQPFHRTQKFYGYYGQGERTVVCGPNSSATWNTYKLEKAGKPPKPFESTVENEFSLPRTPGKGSDKSAIDEESPHIGFAEDNTGLDGRRFIASAKGISLVKRLLLPVPSRLRRPEDGKGDTEKNYKFAGRFGGGPEHKITGDLEATDKYPNLQRAAGLLDLHGYLFNYAGLHPFFWHAKDYKTWEQSELEHAQYNHVVPDYTRLKGSMYLPEPEHQSIRVDQRYGDQNYYASESFVTLLEDGGVVIADGYGAEIRMTAGTVTISAPGDVWFKSGKNTQVWAGRDCIVRANNTVDISSTEQNVRVKAEQNVMILGGNDSSEKLGGVLIESRAKAAMYDFEEPGDAVTFGGVILRAKKAEVITHAKHIYLRTVGAYKGHPEVPDEGNITIDASYGGGTISTRSTSLINYIDKKDGFVFHAFRDALDGYVRVASAFGKEFIYLNGPTYSDGPIIADGKKEGYSFMARNNIFINRGHIYTKKAVSQPKVLPCTGECEEDVNNNVNQIKRRVNNDIPEELQKFHDQSLVPLWYEDKRAGNRETIIKAEFSFRRDQDYRVNDFEIFEDRWQQMARLAGQELDTWEERPVTTYAGDETWPFPGKAKLNEEEVFLTQDFTIAEFSGGGIRDKDRGSDGSLSGEYSSPKFADPERQTLVSGYKIIKP